LDAWLHSMRSNNPEQAEAAALNLMKLSVERAEREPTEMDRRTRSAWECEMRGDWKGAEALYRGILALPETSANPPVLYKTHSRMGALQSLTGRIKEAVESARAEISAARHSGLGILEVNALIHEARLLLGLGDHTAALKIASEAVAAAESIPNFKQGFSHAHIVRARCLAAMGDAAAAQADLDRVKADVVDLAPGWLGAMFAGNDAAGRISVL
jgi:tetratricopeptide (TPR) repeat protein